MPRANRYFLPGHVWHITHRCQGKFVPIVQVVRRAHHERIYSQSLRFVQDVDKDNIVGISREIGMRDRRRYLHWIFEAKKRFGLSVLNYMVTSNHIHLLVRDTGGQVIAQSMQLIAGRTAQEYNQRKGRHGAFWEDRYHATAIEAKEHLYRCLVYIDLNMVRVDVVNHPSGAPPGVRSWTLRFHPPTRGICRCRGNRGRDSGRALISRLSSIHVDFAEENGKSFVVLANTDTSIHDSVREMPGRVVKKG